jgi:AmmeMemoRadiSam system protein B
MPLSQDRPRLRRGLAAAQDATDPRYVFVWDEYRLSNQPQRFSLLEFHCVQLCDGARTVRDIQAEAAGPDGGQVVSPEMLDALLRRLDEALFLDGPRFRQRLNFPVREPSCIGCYEAEPDALRHQLACLFTGPGGPGFPREVPPDGTLRAALVPHMDYERGNVTYGWGFKEIVERADADLFVIVATSHHSALRFILTRKHFKTPLGIARTHQQYVDRLVGHYGDGLFDDEVAHIPEHSIELEVVLLQYLYEGRRDFRIVPLLVGSFHDCVRTGLPPLAQPDISRMVQALQRVEEETKEKICYLISGDLAHLGPKFGDSRPVAEPFLKHSRSQDEAILRQTEAADATKFFRVIADEGDRRRICGLPPTCVVLEAARPAKGRVLHYSQYVHPHAQESVSFASVAFYR